METYQIERTGRAVLAFRGDLVAEAPGRRAAGRDQTRWHDLALYRTAAGRYVLAVEYRTLWEGELGHTFAEIVDLADVARRLGEYDPTACIQGLPARPDHADRQARLLDGIRQRYNVQVSELLGQVPDPAERVE